MFYNYNSRRHEYNYWCNGRNSNHDTIEFPHRVVIMEEYCI